jgi:hypothetical protein
MNQNLNQKKENFNKKIDKFNHSKKNSRLETQELLDMEIANTLHQARLVLDKIV